MIGIKQIEEAAKTYNLEIEKELEKRTLRKPTSGERYANTVSRECSFTVGANWAINEFQKVLWHPNMEEPVPHGDNESHVDCLIETAWGFGVRCWNPYETCWDDEDADDYDCDMKSVKRWAYLDDLIPKKGGKQ